MLDEPKLATVFSWAGWWVRHDVVMAARVTAHCPKSHGLASLCTKVCVRIPGYEAREPGGLPNDVSRYPINAMMASACWSTWSIFPPLAFSSRSNSPPIVGVDLDSRLLLFFLVVYLDYTRQYSSTGSCMSIRGAENNKSAAFCVRVTHCTALRTPNTRLRDRASQD